MPTKLRRLFVLAFWAALIFAYVAAILPSKEAPSISSWDKMNHMIAFFVLTALARLAYPRLPRIWLVVLMAIFGALIELSQAIPIIGRDSNVRDWVADIVATIVALLIAWLMESLAQRGRSRAA